MAIVGWNGEGFRSRNFRRPLEEANSDQAKVMDAILSHLRHGIDARLAPSQRSGGESRRYTKAREWLIAGNETPATRGVCHPHLKIPLPMKKATGAPPNQPEKKSTPYPALNDTFLSTQIMETEAGSEGHLQRGTRDA